MSSVRFICGTQDIHRELEQKLTEFLGTEDTILFPSCMDANGGVFEAVLGDQDVMIADRLVHASIVDGMRLCKAMQDTYKHADMKHLEQKLQEHQDKRVAAHHHRRRVQHGRRPGAARRDRARWPRSTTRWCSSTTATRSRLHGQDRPRRARALRRVRQDRHHHDDARQGARRRERRLRVGPQGDRRAVPAAGAAVPVQQRGAAAHRLRGAQGARDPQHARTERRDKLEANTKFWRQALPEAGFVIKEGDSPIVPIMLFNAKLSQDIARDLFAGRASTSIGFFFPVVPAGQARIRTQMSADHDIPMLKRAIEAFKKVGAKYGILGLDKKGIIEKYGV